METNQRNLLIFGGLGVVVVLFLIMRRGGGSPTVIQSAPAQGSDPNQLRLAEKAINADVTKSLAGLVYANRGLETQANTQLASLNVSRDIGLAQTAAARDVAQAQTTLQSAAISAARDVGLAQASASQLAATQQAQAYQSAIDAQNRNALLSGLFSQVGNILRAIGGQQQSRPSSGGGSGGGSGSGSSGTPQPSRIPPTRINPRLPGTFAGMFGITDPTDYGIGGMVDYPIFPDLGNDYFPSVNDLNPYAPPIPDFTGEQPGTFYVEDPSFIPGGLYFPDPFSFGDPWGFGDPGYGGVGTYYDTPIGGGGFSIGDSPFSGGIFDVEPPGYD